MTKEASYRQLYSDFTAIYQRALAAVDPEQAVFSYLQEHPVPTDHYQRIFLVGAGKGAVPMARGVEKVLGNRLQAGLVVVKDGHGGQLERTRVLEASHPEPDERGVEATRRITSFMEEELTAEDLLIVLLSGGGSALLPLPVEDLTLAEKKQATSVLIRCGADIHEINAIRKHISQVKGGRLLEFSNGATVLALVLSDVVGDDFSSIASGPTSGDPSTYNDCLEILERYRIEDELPASVVSYLKAGAEGGPDAPPETPKPGDARFDKVTNALVATNFSALQAAADQASKAGYQPLILTSSLSGRTADAARFHVAIAREMLRSGNPLPPPCCIISGGETTLQVQGKGKGGRNMEFALWCIHEIRHWQEAPLLFASLGSDGTDGPTDAAGATASFATLSRARARNLSTADFLRRNDSYHFFEAVDDLIVTGPTRTNVMDLHFILVGK